MTDLDHVGIRVADCDATTTVIAYAPDAPDLP